LIARAVGALALALVALGCGRAPITHDDRASIWVETLPAERIDERVAFAAANRLNLNVAIKSDVTDYSYLQSLCRATDGADVALRFWPLLSTAQGYWANQSNVDAYDQWIDQALAWAGGACPRLDGVVVDLEMPYDRTLELEQMRASGATSLAIAQWLVAGIDAQAYDRARAAFDAEGDRVRGRGYRYSVTTLAMIADGYDAGTDTIAQALWTPLDGVRWDAVSFQVYRSIFDQQFPAPNGQPYDSGLIASYAQTILGHFGDRAGIDVGTTGSGIGVAQGLPDAASLQSDLAAARAAGIAPGHLSIYSLEGLDGKPDAPAWVTMPTPVAATPSAADNQLRATFRTLALLSP
jgi:hypothetical protein